MPDSAHSCVMRCIEVVTWFFFLKVPSPPRVTLYPSSAATNVNKGQLLRESTAVEAAAGELAAGAGGPENLAAVSYTTLRAHETVLDIVCRLLL